MARELTGRHVLFAFGLGFGAIIAANVTLAVSAVATFPGLETANSYVASQTFEADRSAQEALGWSVDARLEGDVLRLSFTGASGPVRPELVSAVLGRATHVAADRTPEFAFDGTAFVAPVRLEPGNWNLRLEARAADGRGFRQRIALWVPG